MRRFLPFGLLCAVAFAAGAQERPFAMPAGAAEAPPQAKDRQCPTATGSRIIAARNARAERQARIAGTEPVLECAGSGYSFRQDELRSTGAGDAASALRALSPIVY